MKTSLVAFATLTAAAVALRWPGEDSRVFVAGLALGLAALWLGAGLLHRAFAGLFGRVLAKPRPVIVVDGSNVMHWQGDVPSVKALTLVLADLKARGFAPQVFFDANVGFKLWGRPIDARDLAFQLGLRPDQVTIAPSRTPADPLLIGFAQKAGVRVVSNDRFMDWRAQFPGIGEKGFLVRGEVRGDRVALRLR